jgi:5'-3' exoribonuclease 1
LLEKYSKLSRETTDKELKYDINMDNYKKEYYDTHFKCENSDDIKSICHQYLEGIQWVLSYYTKGVSDWKWCFKYNYAPFAKELTSYTSSFKYQKKDITYPYLPFQQLLSVLPPKSSNLLPFPLCKLLTEDTSSIKKYCPDKFDVDLSGKRKDWEGIVLIPLVNFDIVKKEYDKYIDKVDPKELHRNKLVKSRIYTYSPMQTFTYYSFYGNILNCPVRYQFIDM